MHVEFRLHIIDVVLCESDLQKILDFEALFCLFMNDDFA
jgi:hypothetical protein